MDKIDSIKLGGEIPPHVDITNLSDNDKVEINRFESEAFEAGTVDIQEHIKKIYPDLGETWMEYINYVPAYVILNDKSEQIILNTDLTKDSEVQRIFKRHESVEIIMANKQLDPHAVASQIGIDPSVIVSDQYNGPEHYVAIFHQAILAKELGKTDEMLDTFKSSLRTFLREVVPLKARMESLSTGLNVRQCYAYSRDELIRLNINSLEQIVKKVNT
jgi:hypothetical protein